MRRLASLFGLATRAQPRLRARKKPSQVRGERGLVVATVDKCSAAQNKSGVQRAATRRGMTAVMRTLGIGLCSRWANWSTKRDPLLLPPTFRHCIGLRRSIARNFTLCRAWRARDHTSPGKNAGSQRRKERGEPTKPLTGIKDRRAKAITPRISSFLRQFQRPHSMMAEPSTNSSHRDGNFSTSVTVH